MVFAETLRGSGIRRSGVWDFDPEASAERIWSGEFQEIAGEFLSEFLQRIVFFLEFCGLVSQGFQPPPPPPKD